jgi:hypothetical protein
LPSELHSRSRLLKVLATRLKSSTGSALRDIAAQVFLLVNELSYDLADTLRVEPDRVVAVRLLPRGRVMIVAGPDAATVTIGLHVAACIAAGNTVSLALTTSPGLQLRALVDNLRAVGLKTSNWATADDRGRWAGLPDDLQIAILTESHVSVESMPPVGYPSDCREPQSRRELLRLYSRSHRFDVPFTVCAYNGST